MTEEITEELPEERPEDPDEEGRAAPRASGPSSSGPVSEANGGSTEPRSDDEQSEPRADDHLQDLPDGSGCTEIWEHIARQRADDD